MGPPARDEAFIIVHAIDSNDADQVAKAENAIHLTCRAENVLKCQAADGRIFWQANMIKKRYVGYIPECEFFYLEDWAMKKVAAFCKKHDIRCVLLPPKNPIYTIVPRDHENDEETTAVTAFLRKKHKGYDDFHTFRLPGTGHIFGWSGVWLNEKDKAEVEGHIGVKAIDYMGYGEEDAVLDD